MQIELLNHAGYLLSAAVLGGIIGVEREIHGQPAGLRTHMVLSVGAALAAVISILFTHYLSNPVAPGDPARIVAQVISGIGFLGAGAILRYGINVKGLTTAGSLWTTAIIGIACGSGFIALAAFTSMLVVIILWGVGKLEHTLMKNYKNHTLQFTFSDRPGLIEDVKFRLTVLGIKIISINASMPNRETVSLSLVVRKPLDLKMDKIIRTISDAHETKTVRIADAG